MENSCTIKSLYKLLEIKKAELEQINAHPCPSFEYREHVEGIISRVYKEIQEAEMKEWNL